jgi:hypothetical protein
MCAAYIFQPEAIEIKEEESVADNNMTYKFFTTNRELQSPLMMSRYLQHNYGRHYQLLS